MSCKTINQFKTCAQRKHVCNFQGDFDITVWFQKWHSSIQYQPQHILSVNLGLQMYPSNIPVTVKPIV